MGKGYDILGNIAIIDVERGEKAVARKIMTDHNMITTVIAKAGAVSGKYRTRKFKYVAGEKTYIATYRENNCTFKFDVRKSFFSNRLSFERSRISEQVKNNEHVVVMFAGVGPFAVEIAKENKKASITAIELNKFAYQEMINNVKLNKTENVKPVLGDVKKLSVKFKNSANRIVMPLPRESLNFLDSVVEIAKNKAIVHLYAFGPNETAFDDSKKAIKRHAKDNNYKVKFLFERIARNYSPKEIEVVIDYRIIK